MLDILGFFQDNSNDGTLMESLLPVSVILGVIDLLFITGNIIFDIPTDIIRFKVSFGVTALIYFLPYLIIILCSLACSVLEKIDYRGSGMLAYVSVKFIECSLFVFALFNTLSDLGIIYTEKDFMGGIPLWATLLYRGTMYILPLMGLFISMDLHFNMLEEKKCPINTYNFQFNDNLTETQFNEVKGIIEEILHDEERYLRANTDTARYIEHYRVIEFCENGFLIGLTERKYLFDFECYLGSINSYLRERGYKYKITASREEFTSGLPQLGKEDDPFYVRITK